MPTLKSSEKLEGGGAPSKIDLVYLWCDGAEPKFIEQKLACMKEVSPVFSEENVGDKRYVQHDELRYSLRSVEQNLPWINHIYIVTNNQIPEWLRQHEKITIVDHSEIIPVKLLPTFSSVTIEMYIDRIPGLSEHFIYCNDDMFFAKRLTPGDFFTEDRLPIVWLYPAKPMNLNDALAVARNDERDDHYKSMVRAWLLYAEKRKKQIPFYTPAHTADAYCKSLFQSILKDYPELQDINSSPFRTGKDISRLIFSYELAFTHKCPLILRKKTNFLARVIARIAPPTDFVGISRENVQKMKRDLNIFHPKTFCLNNISAENDKEAKEFFNSLWPKPAAWEKI